MIINYFLHIIILIFFTSCSLSSYSKKFTPNIITRLLCKDNKVIDIINKDRNQIIEAIIDRERNAKKYYLEKDYTILYFKDKSSMRIDNISIEEIKRCNILKEITR